MKSILKKSDTILLYVLVAIVYIIGLLIPLMENDAAQHARTAMRMFLLNDYVNLIKYNIPYLDKPHLHFWLSSFSYKIFGISHFAYRLPSLLITVLGAYSTAKLAELFYGRKALHIAALIFLTSQTIVLGNHDVRTDAVLTGLSIFGIWQLVKYFKTGSLGAIVLGALGAALAFSSKGHLATFVIGICIAVFVIQFNTWKKVLHWKFALGILLWFVFASPVLYAYYIQYDLNGTLVNGNEVSGVKFILWDQNFQRLNGTNFGSTNPDYFFFFHTILWAFFPWTILMIFALINKIKTIKRNKTEVDNYSNELMTSIGFGIVFTVISFSKFKLPHYLNSLIPILSILVSGYLVKVFSYSGLKKFKSNTFFKNFQPILLGIVATLVVILCIWAFPDVKIGLIIGLLLLIIGLLVWIMYTNTNKRYRWFFYTIFGVVIANFCLNIHFYPNLLKYQAGNIAANALKAETENQDLDNVYFLKGNERSWSFEVYLEKLIPELSTSEALKKLANNEEIWLLVYEKENASVKNIPNSLKKYIKRKIDISQYSVTRLNAKFINPNTRESQLKKAYLIKLSS